MYWDPGDNDDRVVTSDAGQQEPDEMDWRPLTPPAVDIDMPSHPPPRPPTLPITPPVVNVPYHPPRPPPQPKTPRRLPGISYPCSTITDSTPPARTTSPYHHPAFRPLVPSLLYPKVPISSEDHPSFPLPYDHSAAHPGPSPAPSTLVPYVSSDPLSTGPLNRLELPPGHSKISSLRLSNFLS